MGLSERALATLKAVLSTQPKVTQAIVYGSRAKGNYREGSDIDLALDAPDLSLSEMGAIACALEDSDLPYMVDLLQLQSLKNQALLEHIQRVGKVLYQADPNA
jgi:uncharacterized protein